MLAAGLALLLRQLRYDHDPLVFTVFFIIGDLSYALVGHTILAYPTGRVTDRAERALVKAAYVTVVAFSLAMLLVYDASRPLLFFDPTPRESLLLVSGSADAVEFLQKSFVVVFYGVLASLLIALIVRRLIRATPRARRILAPLMVGGVAVALRAVFESVFTFSDRPFAYNVLFWWQIAALIALPIALLAGLLRARLASRPERSRPGPRADAAAGHSRRARPHARRPYAHGRVLAARAAGVRRCERHAR